MSTRRPSTRRRAAAALALLLGGATFAAGVWALVSDPLAGMLAVGAMGAAVALAWHGILRRGAPRTLLLGAALVSIALAIGVLAIRDRVIELSVLAVGAFAASAAVRAAFAARGAVGGPWTPVPAPERPLLLVNPRAGGGKARRFALAQEAQARGVATVELRAGDDLAALARQAVADGVDALGIAGGDGSQAVVAAVAAEHEIPFVCVPAGTRNHFALDLGVDRDDPVGALDAFVEGVERRIDLADVNGRTFVNNVSLGVYGRAVHKSRYRQAKLWALLDVLPAVLGPDAPPPPLRFIDDRGETPSDPAAVLISNNPYALDRALGRGTRPRLDTGRLGIVVFSRPSVATAEAIRAWAAAAFEAKGTVAVRAAADGEAVVLEPPLRFAAHAGALRVRISRRHPGVSPSALLPRGLASVVPRLLHIAGGRGATREATPDPARR